MKRIIYLILIFLTTIIWERADFIKSPLVLVIFFSMIIFYAKRKDIYKDFLELPRTLLLISYLLFSLASMVFLFSFGEDTNKILMITAFISFGIIVLLAIGSFFNKVELKKGERNRLLKNLYFDFNLIIGLFLISNNNLFS